MIVNQTAGLIAATNQKIDPTYRLGNISAIERIVITMKEAGIFPIVILTGENQHDIKYALGNSGVIFLHVEECENISLIAAVKKGLEFLTGKCERIVFTPVKVPLFLPKTLDKLLACSEDIVTPSYQDGGGHPVVFSKSIFANILSYTGENGLQGLIYSLQDRHQRVSVEDIGIHHSLNEAAKLELLVSGHDAEILHGISRIMIAKETIFFDENAKLLLYLIADVHSVQKASQYLSISLSKAWEIINTIEERLSFTVVQRRHGGSKGGRTDLTVKGYQIVEAYTQLESEVRAFTKDRFNRLFFDAKILEKEKLT